LELRAGSRRRQRAVERPAGSSGGSIVAQSGIALVQRGSNRHPLGSLDIDGGLPGMPTSGTFGPRIEGNASNSPLL
jgi:hypothetical protein